MPVEYRLTFWTGQCPKGPSCPYIHDPATVAICQTYLSSGECPAGTSCDLSHEATPERVPVCVHFLHGRCSKPQCRYAHVQGKPIALTICRAFANLGFCAKGALCEERHAFECPDYASTGICKSKKCRLRHVDRAGQIRNHAHGSAMKPGQDMGDESDLSSEEEDSADSHDVDSDGLEDNMVFFPQDKSSNVLSEQQDFVHFE